MMAVFLLAACDGINQQGGRRHLAIPSALVRARRAMRPQSDRSRLRAVARPRSPCSPASVYLLAAAISAARRTPQTAIAFQAGRGGHQCTITHRLPLGGSTVLLCRTQGRTRRSALVPDDRVWYAGVDGIVETVSTVRFPRRGQKPDFGRGDLC